MKIEHGKMVFDENTFQPLIPITIYVSVEAVQDMRGLYALDIQSELATLIGNDVVSYLKQMKR